MRRFYLLSPLLLLLLLSGCTLLDANKAVPGGSGLIPTTDMTVISRSPASYVKLQRITLVSALYTPIEFSLQTDGAYANPFDPKQVDLELEMNGPDGRKLSVPAFWYQDFDPASAQPKGQPGWRARFTPSQTGAWTARASLTADGHHLSSDPLEIQVGEDLSKSNRGFVRLNPRNPRYLAFDDGSTFFPVGINMGWGGSEPLADYTRWLDRFSANGGSLIRVWMASWSFGLEWKDTGLGDYTKRLYRAWQLDQVFRLAEERGVTIELVMLNHGAFSTGVNPEWADNPYNAANGGPCARPEDFVDDPTARLFFQRRLRYTAARWAYSPALLAWEWWNEADWTPISAPQMKSWIQAMTPVLKAADPYQHLISTSYAQSSLPEVTGLAEIDFAQLHLYDTADPADKFPRLFQQWSKEVPGKPILFAEFGASAGGENQESADKGGLHLHNGLWAAAFSGFASPAMYWWWDSYVDPLNLWPGYRSLATFFTGDDLAVFTPVSARLSGRQVPARALVSSDRLFVWIHDPDNGLDGIKKGLHQLFLDNQQAGPDWRYKPVPISGLSWKVTALPDGAYVAYWFSPTSGEWVGKSNLTVSNGAANLPIPTFQGDLALKLLPASAPDPTQP